MALREWSRVCSLRGDGLGGAILLLGILAGLPNPARAAEALPLLYLQRAMEQREASLRCWRVQIALVSHSNVGVMVPFSVRPLLTPGGQYRRMSYATDGRRIACEWCYPEPPEDTDNDFLIPENHGWSITEGDIRTIAHFGPRAYTVNRCSVTQFDGFETTIPLAMGFRADTSAAYSTRLSEAVGEAEPDTVRGIPCHRVKLSPTLTCWFAEPYGYAPLRYENSIDTGRQLEQFVVNFGDFSEVRPGLWIPGYRVMVSFGLFGEHYRQRDNAWARQHLTIYRFTQFELDPPFTEHDFRFRWPVGAPLQDYLNDRPQAQELDWQEVVAVMRHPEVLPWGITEAEVEKPR